MITLFVGAGYTGSRVLERLPDAIALGRSRSGAGRLDLDRDDQLGIELPERYAVVYSVPPASDQPGDPRLHRFLTLLPHPPARIVYLSTTGVYGNRDGARVDETCEPRPESARAERRLAAERLLAEWCTGRDTVAVVLRIPGIYGPGRLGTEGIRSGMPVLDEKDANPGNRIQVDDLAACCIAALSPDVPDGIYNVGDGDHRSGSWFTGEVARQAGLPAPPAISFAEAQTTFSPMRLSFLRESRIVDTTKMREVLGVTPKYADAADGIAASLKEETGSG
ncbi:MAG TPA: NAD-dependent epimerase/dehydratase family protein [Woeseiaceae bacterium]|nr:NAD-dependent epimerase/dehydratase family protein [Woeseiaceae bacterium]